MEALLLAAAQGLDAAGVGGWARGSAGVYPIVNVVHVLGVVALVGAIGIVDLRLAGAWRALPLEPLVAALTPVAIAAAPVMLASGVLLFAADGKSLSGSFEFQLKLGLLVIAMANAAAFRWRWHGGAEPRAIDRGLAVASLSLWVAIIIVGRMIAYR